MRVVQQLGAVVSTREACEAMSVSRATYYRHQSSPARASTSRRRSPRALSPAEREDIVDTLHSERFVDQAPRQIYATLLDEGVYKCSPRTMYRLLAERQEVRERRNQLRHPHYQKPELLATQPNEVWSWDISKLLGPVKWTYFYLYVILDIFSRYVVGWMVADKESAELAKKLIRETCIKQGVDAGQLTLHADRGPSMKSHPVALLLAELGVAKTHSRPHVSNDNPYSESHFKTLKYRPEFPDRFGSSQDARAFCQNFFSWYNTEHHHTGIGLMTPEAVHYGRAPRLHKQRQQVLTAFFEAHPERFVRGRPQPPDLPAAAWINPPASKKSRQEALGAMSGRSVDLQVPPVINTYEDFSRPSVPTDRPREPQQSRLSRVDCALGNDPVCPDQRSLGHTTHATAH